MKRMFAFCSAIVVAFLAFGSWEVFGQTQFCTRFESMQECQSWCNLEGAGDVAWIFDCLDGCDPCKWECASNSDCPGTDRCHLTECGECFRDSHCEPDEFCQGRTCHLAECVDDNDCGPGEFCDGAACVLLETPVLISIHDDGFQVTSWQKGVFFDIDADGRPERTAWTDAESDDAFLVLDRNGNGKIDDASELFGNHTQQEPSDDPNGFRALARLDDPALGGNLDGLVTPEDRGFHKLQLWFDMNHNGSSDSGELTPLALFVASIDLNYREFQRVDEYGNRYPYKTEVIRHDGSIGIACDVLFVVEQTAKNLKGRLPLRRD